MKIYTLIIAILCLKSTVTEGGMESSSPGGTDGASNSKPHADVVTRAVNDFGFKLLKAMMRRSENENIVMSPTSITGLLAMTLLGSAGTTYDELAQLIGFSQDILINRGHHEELGLRLQSLSANDTRTLYANGAFVDQRAKLRDLYQQYLTLVYRGEALPTDFTDGDAARALINEWVKTHTGNRIEEFLQQPLPTSTKAVLLSALYFSGQWALPFVPEYTAKLPFKTPTKEVLVDLMANFGQFNYIFSFAEGIQMVALPYNDSVTTMYVLKPRFPKRQNISSLLEDLDYERIDNLIGNMSMKKCVLRIPKMQLESKVNLKEPLVDLGAKSMFLPGEANFALMLDSNKITNSSEEELITRIATGDGEAETLKDMVNKFPNPGIHIDSVMHQVKINIDEYGTEAVAATSAIMARTAEIFYADSPFYLFIRNERTKLVTFSAVVFDPSI